MTKTELAILHGRGAKRRLKEYYSDVIHFYSPAPRFVMPRVTGPRQRKPPLAKTLLNSAISHMIVAVEFFNKPTQPHRYELASELVLAAWEKVLKAYLYRLKPRYKIFLPDGKTISFNECRDAVRQHLSATPEAFLATHKNLGVTYTFRNLSVHLYGQGMDSVLHGLFAECIVKFAEFIREHFGRELLSSEELGILPVGFQRPIIPQDFLSLTSSATHAPPEVLRFLKEISDAGEELNSQGLTPEHSVLVSYFVHLQDSRKPADADLVVKIDNSPGSQPILAVHKHLTATDKVRLSTDKNAPAVVLQDNQIWEYFNLDYQAVRDYIKANLPHVKFDARFNAVMKRLAGDDTVTRTSYSDPIRKKGPKNLYCDTIYQKLINEYGEAPVAQNDALPASKAKAA